MSFQSRFDQLSDYISGGHWDGVRRMLRSNDWDEFFASTNFEVESVLGLGGHNAFHEVCFWGDEAPVDILSAILAIDEMNLTRKTDNKFRATPLHLACDTYAQTPDLIRMLLSLRPDQARAMACDTDSRGFTPLDILWLKFLKYGYINYVDDGDDSAAYAISFLSDVISNRTEDISRIDLPWAKTMAILYAMSTNGGTEIPASWSAVHAIASANIKCPNFVVWLALKKYPKQVSIRDEYGNLPLHLAAACRNHYRYPLTSEVDETGATITSDWEEDFPEKKGMTKEVMDVVQASPVRMLAEMYPGAASAKNEEGRLPLHIAVQRGAEWAGEVQPLFAAFPGAANEPDPETRLLPFMLAAVGLDADASIDLTYMLLRSNPANVSSGIRRTEYEQYLERKVEELMHSKLKRKAEHVDLIEE